MRIVSSGATHNSADTALAYDGAQETRWGSLEPMQSYMAYWVTLDKPAMVSGIRAVSETWPGDNPRGWLVAVMDDEGGHGRREVARGTGKVIANWPAVRGQVVRIELTRGEPSMWWSIEQLDVFGEDAPPEPEPPPPEPPPPEPPPPDPSQPPEFGVFWPPPESLPESQARLLVEMWAEKFGWEWYHERVMVPRPGGVTERKCIRWPLMRADPSDVTIEQPWPWE